MRTLVVGDVHGCIDELDALLDATGFGGNDSLIFVGDLVAKGPCSQRVVTRARESGARSVLGNHDAAVLRYLDLRDAGEPTDSVKPVHRDVAEALTAEDVAYLRSLPLVIRVDDVLVVHAGFVPGVAIDAQRREDLLNMRSIRSDGSASKRVSEGVPWATQWRGPEHVVFGHDAIRGLQREAFATGLDTGCVYGRELTALILPAHELVSVPSRRVYAAVG